MIENQEIIIGQNEDMMSTVSEYVYDSTINKLNIISNQEFIIKQNSMVLSIIIVAVVILFWFKRRRTKWM
ncbi:MAG TPA: hypothetical protein PLL98_11935 [Bacillota bacterium]|nr:hypothetical protein [Bacillota bacterium]